MRTLISRDFERAFSTVDVLISPSAPTTAFKIGEKVDDPWPCTSTTFAPFRPISPATPAPPSPLGSRRRTACRSGLQVMAPPLADDRLYRVGAALERALGAMGWLTSGSRCRNGRWSHDRQRPG